ncbi:MAG: hypothetical protein E6J69_00715 [Deltaproteobacteria bacterium]|nr:MAG: hypothetical protein E6J69_00715 [Deltaproteobacteria bacterium]
MTGVADRLRSPSVEDRVAAIAELGHGDAGTAELEALALCLGHDHKLVQRRAAEAFAALDRRGTPVRAVLAAALRSTAARQRWGAAYALALLGAPPRDTLPVLLETLGEDDGDLRWAAARIVVRMRDEPELVRMLAELAARGRGPQRKMALYCIRDLGAPSTDAEGVAAAALGDPDVGVRLAALSTLPAVAVDRVTASHRLLSLLEDPDGGVRRAAAVALGELGTGSEEVVAALHAAAASEDASLKRAAERALRRLG